MGVFEFIILIVVIITLGEVGKAVLQPLAQHGGELLKEMAAERRAGRQGGQAGAPSLDPDVIEELEGRLTRIEDRLDFLEELRSPARPPALEPSDPTEATDHRRGP
jgi:hypothetical protein